MQGLALRGAMQRSMPIISTKVALIGGFLLLGLLAVAAWLLLSASPASAQTQDAGTAPDSASTDPVAAQVPTSPAPPDSTAQPPIDLNFMNLNVPDLPPLPVDLTPLTQTLQPVREVLPPALQPAVTDVVELLPAPVRAPVESVLSGPAPSPSRGDPAPGANAVADESVPPGPTADADTNVGREIRGRLAHSRDATGLRTADSSLQEGGTRAPPGPAPAVPALGSSVSSFSAGRDFGQTLLLLGVVAAGVLLILGRGRRLLTEALGWLPAPWCALIERPG
jgi:hypothetical protein